MRVEEITKNTTQGTSFGVSDDLTMLQESLSCDIFDQLEQRHVTSVEKISVSRNAWFEHIDLSQLAYYA